VYLIVVSGLGLIVTLNVTRTAAIRHTELNSVELVKNAVVLLINRRVHYCSIGA